MNQSRVPSAAETPSAEHPSRPERLLAHDLRSALADVVDGLRLVDPARLPERSRTQFDRAQIAAATLARLLDTALDSDTPMRSGPPRPETPPAGGLDLHRFLHEIEQRWGGRAESFGLKLRVALDAGVPPRIRCDRTVLDRILSNLLGNAIKFTPSGTVTLRADVRAGNELRLTVADTGPGFSDAALRAVFAQSPEPGRSSEDGSGLGLHIARSLAAQALGGRLQACNGAEGGAELSLLLPEAMWRPDGPSPAPDALPDLTGRRILLAEDNGTSRLVAGQMLSALGATVIAAQDGAAALEVCARETPDLALIDIEMPRLDGLELMRMLRGDSSGPAVMPMLALTAYVLPDDRRRIYAAGADRILAKPIMDLRQFGEAIASVLADRPAVPSPLVRARLDHLMTLAGAARAPDLLDQLGRDLAGAQEGLARAVETEAMDLAGQHAHVAASLAATLGACAAEDAARNLGAAARAGQPERLQESWERLDPALSELRALIAIDSDGGTAAP